MVEAVPNSYDAMQVKKVVMQQLQTRGGDPNNAATKELLAKLILQVEKSILQPHSLDDTSR